MTVYVFQFVQLARIGKAPGAYDKYDHQNLDGYCCLWVLKCCANIFACKKIAIISCLRIRRHVNNLNTTELLEAWNDKEKRNLVWKA